MSVASSPYDFFSKTLHPDFPLMKAAIRIEFIGLTSFERSYPMIPASTSPVPPTVIDG